MIDCQFFIMTLKQHRHTPQFTLMSHKAFLLISTNGVIIHYMKYIAGSSVKLLL